jgi:hypothetical protein
MVQTKVMVKKQGDNGNPGRTRVFLQLPHLLYNVFLLNTLFHIIAEIA